MLLKLNIMKRIILVIMFALTSLFMSGQIRDQIIATSIGFAQSGIDVGNSTGNQIDVSFVLLNIYFDFSSNFPHQARDNQPGNGGLSNDYQLTGMNVGYTFLSTNKRFYIAPIIGVLTKYQLYNDWDRGGTISEKSWGYFNYGAVVGTGRKHLNLYMKFSLHQIGFGIGWMGILRGG